MQIEKLHYLLELEWNKNSNAHRKGLTDLEKDMILNMSIFDYVEMFLHGINSKGFDIGFEVTTQMLDMLDTLVVSYPEQPELYPAREEDGLWMIDLSRLKYTFKNYKTSWLFIEGCELPFEVSLEQHGDRNNVLKSHHRKASRLWKHIPAFLRNNKLYLHTGDMVPDTFRITYIKKPAEVCIGTYQDIPTVENPNPPLKNKVECDLPEEYHYLLIRIAVQNLYRIYGEVQQDALIDKKISQLT